MKDYNGKVICLNMIVKNEAHVIQETLDNIVKYIDYWIICDTGSTDGTQDLVKAYFKRKGIPGELKQHQWQDFGTNRTLALEACQGKCDYIFVVDADDLIVGEFVLPKKMTADAYQLKYGSDFTYHRTQLFGNHLKWKYVGVLHEYPQCTNKKDVKEDVIEGNYYMDSRRLGARSKDPEKYLKDGKILAAAMEKELNGGDKSLAGRYAFYAGQSFIDYGDFENGVKYYQKRIDMGGWFEETYYAYYKVAMGKKFLNRPESEIEEAFLNAHNFLPSRAEPLYELALYFRGRNNFKKAFRYSQKAIKIPFPKDQKLFISKEFYDWKIKDEYAISAYYLQEYQECFNTCLQLLREGFVPEDQRLRIEANRDFCVPFLKDKFAKYNAYLVQKIRKNVKKTKRQLVTYSITTCKRFDLFERTINSFLNCCEDVLQIDRWLCVDDNSSEADRAKMKKLYPFFDFYWKGPEEKGHPESMNIIVREVKTPYLLHMEDDWQFFEPKEYVKPALEILKENDKLGQVCFNRNYAEVLADRDIPGGHLRFTKGARHRFLIHEHYHPDSQEYKDFHAQHDNRPSSCYWPHYSLRPSLLKTEIFKTVGDYNENTTHFEMEFSYRYFDKGYLTGFYDGICSLHIGRLTSERNDTSKKNAYELNDESQFGNRAPKEVDKTKTVKRVSWADQRDTTSDNASDEASSEPDLSEKDNLPKNSDKHSDYDAILESARKEQNKGIPIGMDNINASPKIKNAIDDIITNYQIDADSKVMNTFNNRNTNSTISTPVLKEKEFDGYLFFPNKDSMGHDIQHLANKTVEQLKDACDQDPHCLGFNTLGYMKHTICDESDFITLPNYDGKLSGLYVNKAHVKKSLDKVMDKIMGKKMPVAVIIKQGDDYDEFVKNMQRFLLQCRDLEIVKTWICLNYDVDCDTQDKIVKEYPFFQHVMQKVDGDSLKDVMKILNEQGIEYIFSWKDDFVRQAFNLRNGISQCVDGIHYFQTDGRGPYMVKLSEMDWQKL